METNKYRLNTVKHTEERRSLRLAFWYASHAGMVKAMVTRHWASDLRFRSVVKARIVAASVRPVRPMLKRVSVSTLMMLRTCSGQQQIRDRRSDQKE